MLNIFKVNNKDTKTTLMTSNMFYIFSSVFIVDFEQVNNTWVRLVRRYCPQTLDGNVILKFRKSTRKPSLGESFLAEL